MSPSSASINEKAPVPSGRRSASSSKIKLPNNYSGFSKCSSFSYQIYVQTMFTTIRNASTLSCFTQTRPVCTWSSMSSEQAQQGPERESTFLTCANCNGIAVLNATFLVDSSQVLITVRDVSHA